MSASSSILYAQALGLGFDEQFLATMINRYGGDVLALLVKAAHAYSLEFVSEAIERLGPVVLQIAVEYFQAHGPTPPADGSEHTSRVFDVIKSVVGV